MFTYSNEILNVLIKQYLNNGVKNTTLIIVKYKQRVRINKCSH